MSSSVSSEMQELADFTKARLPQLVEANLRPMIDTDLATVEPRLRQLLPDIVKSCQEAINQSFRAWRDLKTTPSSSSKPDSISEEAQATSMMSPFKPGQVQERSMMHELDHPTLPSPPSLPLLEDFYYISSSSHCRCNCHVDSTELAGKIVPPKVAAVD